MLFNVVQGCSKVVQRLFKVVQGCSRLFKGCSRLFKVVQGCSKVVQKLFKSCSKVVQRWFKVVQRLFKGCSKVVQKWFKVVQGGSRLFKVVQCCSKVVQGCSKVVQRLFKSCSMLFNVVQRWFKVVQGGSRLFNVVQCDYYAILWRSERVPLHENSLLMEMYHNVLPDIVRCIGRIYEKTEYSELSADLFSEIESELKMVSDKLKISENESLVFSIAFVMNLKGDTLDLDDILRHTRCNPIFGVSLMVDLENLVKARLLEIKQDKHSQRQLAFSKNEQYFVPVRIFDSILKNKPIFSEEVRVLKDLVDVLAEFYRISKEVDDDEISTSQYYNQIRKLITNYSPTYSFLQEMSLHKIEDACCYMYLVWKSLNGYKRMDLSRMLESIMDSDSDRIKYIQHFISGENSLIVEDLIERDEPSYFNDIDIKLTDKSREKLEIYGLKLPVPKSKFNNLSSHQDIEYKRLIYNEEQQNNMNTLFDILKEDKLSVICDKLSAKGLPTGIAILFHGEPGTGKTESVYQLARESGRSIMKVEISETKSMWFGESEKLIKGVFTDYRKLCEESKIAPILLFNEADAIISKRLDINGSSVRQTENAIQNILLEELERFKGIFIATTNLVLNLDAAFERRFLYKVNFNKPGIQEMAEIWRLKLPFLTIEQSKILANYRNLTGGEIDNIARKVEISNVINENSVTFDTIIDFCNDEHIRERKGKPIGYLN